MTTARKVKTCAEVKTYVCVCVSLSVSLSVQAGAERVRSQLQHIQRVCPDRRRRSFTVTLQCADEPTAQSDTLHAQLSALQALAIEPPKLFDFYKVELQGLPMTHKVMQALRGLPEWTETLDLSTCTWPLAACEYAQLAQCIPTAIRTWGLGDLAGPVFESICEGVPAQQEGVNSARSLLLWVEGDTEVRNEIAARRGIRVM